MINNIGVIQQFTRGRVVTGNTVLGPLVGHVVGFRTNADDRVLVIVDWCDGDRYSVIPEDLNPL